MSRPLHDFANISAKDAAEKRHRLRKLRAELSQTRRELKKIEKHERRIDQLRAHVAKILRLIGCLENQRPEE